MGQDQRNDCIGKAGASAQKEIERRGEGAAVGARQGTMAEGTGRWPDGSIKVITEEGTIGVGCG